MFTVVVEGFSGPVAWPGITRIEREEEGNRFLKLYRGDKLVAHASFYDFQTLLNEGTPLSDEDGE